MVDSNLKKIGDKLSRTRESMGLTLQQLANIVQVAPSTIQKIESGTMIPSIAVMMKVARGLQKKIGFFLDEDESSAEVVLFKKQDRLPYTEGVDHPSVRKLTTELVNPEMDGFILLLPPGASSGEEPIHHHGEELVYCIRGKVTYTIDGEHYTMGPGDCLHFKSKLPHSYKNTGRFMVELLSICSVPILTEVFNFGISNSKEEDKSDNDA